MPRRHKVVSLFRGARGLDLGLEDTGRVESLLCVDHFGDALETLRLNSGHVLTNGGVALGP
jgi:site-specific DNA-cytosine methylase